MLALAPMASFGQFVSLMPMSGPTLAAMPSLTIEGLPDMEELSGLISQMKQTMSAPRPTATNPCAEDIRRLGCRDTACLKRAAETLAPACAALLLADLEPSPAPVLQRIRSGPPALSSGGYFTISSSGSDGNVQRISGPIDVSVPRSPSPLTTPGLSMMMSMLPPEISNALAAALQEAEEQEEAAEKAEEAQHPCAQEVNACVRETGCNSRSAIEGCLVKHFTQLTAECQCFVHHITNGRVPTQAAAAPVAVAIRTVSTPMEARTSHAGGLEVTELGLEPDHSAHSLSCLIVFTGLFLLSFFIMRAIVTLLCCPTRGRRSLVVVPPEHTTIKAVAAPPLLVSEITKPIQVAEPLSKA